MRAAWSKGGCSAGPGSGDIARINHFESDEYLAELRPCNTDAGPESRLGCIWAWTVWRQRRALVPRRMAADRKPGFFAACDAWMADSRAGAGSSQGSRRTMTLSAAQLADYRRDGFLVLEGFVPEAACDRLRARMAELLAGFDAEGVRTVFATDDQRHAQDDWFLEFRRQDPVLLRARRRSTTQGGLRQPKELSINKVGHALHDLDPVFAAFSRDPSFAAWPRDRPRPAAAAAVDVHLQAAADRRRGGLPPGQHASFTPTR